MAASNLLVGEVLTEAGLPCAAGCHVDRVHTITMLCLAIPVRPGLVVGKGNRKDRTAWTGRESGSVAWPHAFTWTQHTEEGGGGWGVEKSKGVFFFAGWWWPESGGATVTGKATRWPAAPLRPFSPVISPGTTILMQCNLLKK